MNNPEAVYDTLFIGQRLQNKIDDFSQFEVQFFAYFSCLLSLYDGNAIDKWMYTFVKTELGSPYSTDIDLSIQNLNASQFIKQTETSIKYFTVTEQGVDFFKFHDESANIFSNRKKYLTTACNTILLIPFGSIKEAVNKEPVLNSASNSLAKRNLLEESNPATKVLYSQFRYLRLALEDKYNDLIVPAIVWLESLNTVKKEFITE